MESVQIRQRGAYDFESHYDSVCALHGCCPLAAVKAHLSQGILDLNGDRISLQEWKPILSSLSINKNLEFVAVTSNHLTTDKGKENKVPKWKRKQPAIRGKEVNHELCKAIRKCLLVSPALACLKLQGVPLRDSDVLYLAKGLNKNSSLNYLSLAYCRIGDNGLETIGRAIKNNLTLNVINLTGCSLTWQGADIFARIIKHQAMCRHGEAWKDSLRYRRPDLERMSGLRRITLNNNPLIGDHGALVLAEALRDDLWVKALDLQGCGITNVGAKSFSDMLLYNTTLVVLDVRANPMIDQMLIHSITEQVMLNSKAISSDNSEPEYDWIKLEPNKVEQKPKIKKKVTKVLNNSTSKKTSIKINGVRYNLKNSRSNSSLRGKAGSSPAENPQPERGLPWRTAARAVKQRGCFSSHDEYYEPDGSLQIIADTHPHKKIPRDQDGNSSPLAEKRPYQVLSPYNSKDCENIVHGISMLKNLKVELEHVKRELSQERQARKEADKIVLELTLENERLLVENEQLRRKNLLLDDEKVLEAIETSFKQFHTFLDVLRYAGLGDLIHVAGLDEKNLFNTQKMPLNSATKAQVSDPHNKRSSFQNSSFTHRLTPTNSQALFKSQEEQQTKEMGQYTYNFPLTNAHHHTHHDYNIRNVTGGQKSLLEELVRTSLQGLPENPKDLNSTFDIEEAINEALLTDDIQNVHQEHKDNDSLSAGFEQKDPDANFNVWEKTKTLVNGSILIKPEGTNVEVFASPPPANSKTENSWLEDSFNRAKIVEDILKKAKLKDMEEDNSKFKKSQTDEGHKSISKVSVFENKEEETQKAKKILTNFKESGFNIAESKKNNRLSEKDKNGTIPAVEKFEVKDLRENGTNSANFAQESDHSLKTRSDIKEPKSGTNLTNLEQESDHSVKTRKNKREPMSPSFRNKETVERRERRQLSEKVEDISPRQEMPSYDKPISQEVFSDASAKNVPPQPDDSAESKVTSYSDESFSLGTIDLSQVSNQCDTPPHSHIKLDSIHGLDDTNSQDTSPLKSMSDEDF